MSIINVVIPIDDTHPESGWGMPDDECTRYLIDLNSEFGCKFVHFIPSNYHNKFPLSQFKDWVDYWRQFDWIELAAHGHLHSRQLVDPGCRECEFVEFDYSQAKSRLDASLEQWDLVGVRPRGWRMPGWLATQESFRAVSEYFDYVAIHGYLNDNINISNIKVFKGENSIHDASSITLFDNHLLFQSHIAGAYNKNNWTRDNYEYFRRVLTVLKEENELQYKTFSDLC